MTGPAPDDESAEYLEGDYLTVEQLARLRQVTPAAVRAQLRAGNLDGEQVLQGQRTVWRIPVSAARGYLGRSGAAPPAREPAPSLAPVPAPPASTPPASTPPPSAPPPSAPPPSARVAALEAEVRRLRRQLASLTEAHRRLLDAVGAGWDDEAS